MSGRNRNFPKGAGDWKPEGEKERVNTETDDSMNKETSHGQQFIEGHSECKGGSEDE